MNIAYTDHWSPEKPGLRILGTGMALPSRVIENREFEKIVATSDDWIVQRTGIRSRRFCDEDESSATLAVSAARLALENAEIQPDQIDLIICGTVTPERTTPTNAAQVQAALGCRQVPAFDVTSACCGFMFALGIAQAMIVSGAAETALVIGAEALSRALDYTDRNSCILFGDGAGAVVASRTSNGQRGIRYLTMGTNGSKGDLIQVPGIAPADNCLATRVRNSPPFIFLEGPEVYRFAVRTMAELLRELQRDCGIEWNDIAAIVPHQVNERVFEAVSSQLGIPLEKCVRNIDRLANTASASIPMALDEAQRAGQIKSGDNIVLVAFGGGLSWSASLVNW